MKMMLMDIMTAMMPYMKPLVWLALAAFIAGLALALMGGEGSVKFVRLAFGIVLGVGVFFIAAQLMGLLLGAGPSINFGDPRKFQFILVPFWQLGIACLAGAGVLKLLLRRHGRPFRDG